jgi:hypothetical protein
VARGKRRKTEAEEMYLSMASRAGSQNGVVFTDRVAQRSRRSFDVWAAAEGSASWHIEEARQARQWFDERFGKTNASSTTVTLAA